jgi:hypothetical protein
VRKVNEKLSIELLDIAKYDSVVRLYLELYFTGQKTLAEALTAIIVAKHNTINNLTAEIVFLANAKGSDRC